MRFRFCGDQDCPDWALAEIATLSKITSIKMKLLCAQVIKGMLGNELDYDKIYRLTSDAKYTTGDVKGSIAALQFIFASSTKHSVDEDSLSQEIQQLGLPKEHSSALCKLYGENFKDLFKAQHAKSLRLFTLDKVQWRVDYILGSSHLQLDNKRVQGLHLYVDQPYMTSYPIKNVCCPMATLNLWIRSADDAKPSPNVFSLTTDKLQVLLAVQDMDYTTKKAIQKLVPRYDQCLNLIEDYVEM